MDSAYVWGFAGCARYLGISRITLWRILNSPERTKREKDLLSPRIISGRPAFKKSNLDEFMRPAMNAEGAQVHDPFSRLKS